LILSLPAHCTSFLPKIQQPKLQQGSTLAAVDDRDLDVAAIPRIMFNVSAASNCKAVFPFSVHRLQTAHAAAITCWQFY
jgi:hypothetical protein